VRHLPLDHPPGEHGLLTARRDLIEDDEAVPNWRERVSQLVRQHREKLGLAAVNLAKPGLDALALKGDRNLEPEGATWWLTAFLWACRLSCAPMRTPAEDVHGSVEKGGSNTSMRILMENTPNTPRYSTTRTGQYYQSSGKKWFDFNTPRIENRCSCGSALEGPAFER
jgi:hypothetical protein